MGAVEAGPTSDLRGERHQATDQVEGEEAQAAHRVLDVGPKMARNSMLPAMCRRLPWRNIDVNGVSHVGSWPAGARDAAADRASDRAGPVPCKVLRRGQVAVLARVRDLVGDRAVVTAPVVVSAGR